MAILEALTLAGVRRFGRETTIEFSPHATILLAPNGTGKTTVFESIELALTGMISRLQREDEMKALVREGATDALVRVAFDTATTEVAIDKLGAINRSGDVSGLFPDVAPADVPYLLRLTHLLDQRERSWFIQADPKQAGLSLSKLPVGREGAIASAALVPVRKNVTERIKANISRTAALMTQTQEWEALISERDKAASAASTSLKPLESIYQELSDLAALGGMEETLAPDWRSSGGKVQALGAFHASLSSRLTAKQNNLTERIKLLAELVGSLQPYQADRQRLAEDSRRMAELRSTIENSLSELATRNLERDAAQLAIARSQSRSVAMKDEISAIRALDRAREVLSAARAKNTIDIASLQSAEDQLALIRVEVSKLIAEEEELARSSHQVSLMINLEASLIKASAAARAWRDEVAEANRLDVEIAATKDQVARLADAYADAVKVLASLGRTQREASDKYSAASASVGEVRRAVSLIVTHLPSDSADCPACGVHHGAEDLQRRLQMSLSTDNLALQSVEAELKSISGEVAKQQSVVDESLRALQAARTKLESTQERLSEIQSNADAYARTEHLSGWSTPDLALEAILQRLDRASADLSSQRTATEQLNVRTSSPEAMELRSILSSTQIRVDGLRSEARASRENIERATIEMASLQQSASDRGLAELEEERVALDDRIAAEASRLESLEAAASTITQLVSRLSAELSAIELQAGEIQSRIALLESKWRSLSLPGSPSSEVITASLESVEAELKFTQRSVDWITALSGDLEARLVAEQKNAIQELIEQRKGGMSEGDFSRSLQTQKSSLDVQAQELAKLSSALEALSRKLAAEIDNVYDYIAAVVPSWQVLLKRIVREPRFANTTLGLQNHYRRPVASVSVQMNGEDIAAPLIASEAQMTDLQLTFLLSMALNHKWSTWRGLLLDDPTQHHDLVHASSVFDVLRDYIVDHGFQVVLATHDASQARYFKRKLLNDGVDARIWSLVPEDGGVAARESR